MMWFEEEPLRAELITAWDLSHGFLRRFDGVITFWYTGSERLYGWTKRQAIGRVSHDLLQTHFPKPLPEIEAELLAQGSWQGELSHVTSSGKRVTVASSWVLRRDEAGLPASVIVVNNDISDRIRGDEATVRLAAIVQSSNDAIIGMTLEGTITSWNASAEQLFGYRAAEIIGQPVSKLTPPEMASEDEAIFSQIRRGQGIEHFETIRVTKTNQRPAVSLTISAIRNARGEIVGASTIARDVTARKKMEDSLRRTNLALEQFAYAAAHDLQEPLRNVALSLQLARADHQIENSETEELIEVAIENSRRMNAMVRDLLAFSRALDSEDHSAPVAVDAGQVLRLVLRNLEAAIREANAQIVCDSLPWVAVSEIHLLQILQNLLGNAIKYRGSDPPQIHVGATEQDGEWLFYVRDNGIGIPAHLHERAFGVFKRLKNSKVLGTGVGLAICKRIVEHYGGVIRIESNPVKGVTFFFSLPSVRKAHYELCER